MAKKGNHRNHIKRCVYFYLKDVWHIINSSKQHAYDYDKHDYDKEPLWKKINPSKINKLSDVILYQPYTIF